MLPLHFQRLSSVLFLLDLNSAFFSINSTFLVQMNESEQFPISVTNEHSPIRNCSPIELSQIVVPTIVLPNDDRPGFAQKERLGLPVWTMILAIRVSVDVSKILTFEFPVTSGASSILTSGKSGYCIWCLSCASRKSWNNNVHEFCGSHLWYLLSFFSKKLRVILNHLSQCHLGEYHSAFVLLILRLYFWTLEVTEIHQWSRIKLF